MRIFGGAAGPGTPREVVPQAAATDSEQAATAPEENRFTVALNTSGYGGGARLLLSDVSTARVLLNEARYRTIERLFGVPRENAGLLTLVALGTLAAGVRAKATESVRVPGGLEATIGASLLREGIAGIAGPAARDTPMFGTLILIAIVGAKAHPAARASWHAMRKAAHVARADFDHRYGHLIRRNGSR